MTLNNLGVLAEDQGDLKKAADYYHQSFLIKRQKAPDSHILAETFNNMGNLAQVQGDWAEAENKYLQALAINEQKVPNSLNMASTLHNLAKIYRSMNQISQSQKYFESSINVLDLQLYSLGGSQMVKTDFLIKNQKFYSEFLHFLMEQNEIDRAFEVLERSRAKVLRDMMAERDLILTGKHLPQELDAQLRSLA